MKIGKVEKSRDGWNLRKGGDLRKKKIPAHSQF